MSGPNKGPPSNRSELFQKGGGFRHFPAITLCRLDRALHRLAEEGGPPSAPRLHRARAASHRAVWRSPSARRLLEGFASARRLPREPSVPKRASRALWSLPEGGGVLKRALPPTCNRVLCAVLRAVHVCCRVLIAVCCVLCAVLHVLCCCVLCAVHCVLGCVCAVSVRTRVVVCALCCAECAVLRCVAPACACSACAARGRGRSGGRGAPEGGAGGRRDEQCHRKTKPSQ